MQDLVKRYIIKIPTNVEVFYCDKRQVMLINGPYGKKVLKLKTKIELCEILKLIKIQDSIFEKISSKNKKTLKSLRGTTVALIKQAFLEVSTVIYKKLSLVGVGYKAHLVELNTGNLIHFKLGYSHSIYFKIPEKVNIKANKNSKLFVSGQDLNYITQIAALLRSYKVPEPYKGKGIVDSDETIKLKEGKKL